MAMAEGPHVAIGRRIRQIREFQGFTQAALAILVGVRPSHISRIEEGATQASVGLLYALADALRVSMADLFFTEEPKFDRFYDVPHIDLKNRDDELPQGETKEYFWKLLLSHNTGSKHPLFHPYLVKFKGEESGGRVYYHVHRGFEIVILISGQLTICLSDFFGKKSGEFSLSKPFDLAIFEATAKHAYLASEEALALCIISDTKQEVVMEEQKKTNDVAGEKEVLLASTKKQG